MSSDKIRRVLVRTDSEEFGHNISTDLKRKGAKVTVTSQLNDVGNALLPVFPQINGAGPYWEVLRDGIGVFLFGDSYTRPQSRYDLVVFDPFVKDETLVNPRFHDKNAREVAEHICIDDTFFLDEYPMGKERNYLGWTHYMTGDAVDKLPNETVKGLAFMQEMKEAGRSRWNGLHPNYPFVFASDDKNMKTYARLMHSFGFIDYSDGGLEFERANWLSDIERAKVEVIANYLSSNARAAIATSALVALPSMATLAVAQTQPQPKPEIRISASAAPGKDNDYACVGYWVGTPRARACITDAEHFSFGSFVLPKSSKLKIAASRNGEKEEAGLYVRHDFKDLLVGGAAEYIDDELSAELHARLDLPHLDRVFVAYGFPEDTLTIGNALDLGAYHFLIAKSMGGSKNLRAYTARDGLFKFFYTHGKNSKNLSGFVRFGGQFAPYTPRGFDGDRLDHVLSDVVHSPAQFFHPMLPQPNTHLSDQGIVAFEPRLLVTPKERRASLRGFYTHNRKFVLGYGVTRTDNGDTNYNHAFSTGVNIGPYRVGKLDVGPLKIVGTHETGKGNSAYVMFRLRP